MSKVRTTAEIRSLFTDGDFWDGSDFDCWLEAHDAEVTAQAEARIIKLLDERYAENVDHCEWGTHLFLDNAIALIKGKAE